MKYEFMVGFTAMALVLSACSSRNSIPSSPGGAHVGVVGSSVGLSKNTPGAVAPMQGNYGNFNEWKSLFRARALSSGVSAATYTQVEPYLIYKPQVVSSDRSQAEFVKPIWDYVDSAVGPRTGPGRAKAAEWSSTLSAIENKYNVNRSVLLGIWGMETNFGGFMGSTNVFSAMSTLSYEGRRRDWAEKQLINAMRIVQAGDRSASNMKGSWAGGMGHTQFIPEMFNTYAVDFTGDGQRDIWYPTDALASTANYLRNEGWVPGQPWGVEVRLPANFNYLEADTANFKPSSYWSNKGVQATGGALPSAETAIYLPAGHRGPAFAITRNFAAIKRYNPSDSYALAVSLVGDTALGRPGVQAAWPRDEQPLRKSEIIAVQTRLMSLGYDTGGADGIAGSGTRRSVKQYQASIGMTPDGFLNRTFYNRIVN